MTDTLPRGVTNNGFVLDNPDDYDPENNANYKTEFQLDNNNVPAEPSKPSYLKQQYDKHKSFIKGASWVLVHLIVGAYFAYATYHYIHIEDNCSYIPHPLCGIQFCNGYGFLVLLVGFVYIGLFYYTIFKPKIGRSLHRNYIVPFDDWWMRVSRTWLISTLMIGLVVLGLAIFLYFETRDKPDRLRSLTAPVFFVLMGYIFSSNRKAIQWRLVITGMTCQFILGIICVRWSVGRQIFECIGQKVARFLAFTDEGSRFVFGEQIVDTYGVFAFAILSVIFFFSFFISILYYIGAMQWVVMRLGWILQQLLGTTVCESVTSAANIFLGMSESPLLIRPYINRLTASEIHSIMVSGFATVSGTVLAAYINYGASPALLITSSVMAAPASLAISKLYLPETEESQTTSSNIQLEKSEDTSILDAASNGASNAVPIVQGIIANIVAFVAFIAFLNAVVNWFGFLVGIDDIDFEWLFSKLFIPLAWAMGVHPTDCNIVAKVVATKTIINEFVAYERLGVYAQNDELKPHSIGIATFAICGFANPSSLGILIGSLGAMAPKRRGLITSVAFRAFVVGSIVCFTSASFASILLQEDELARTYDKIFQDLANKNITLA